VNEVEPTTTTCGDDEAECTNQDYCDGDGGCTDNDFKPDTTECGNPGDDICDLQDTCSGSDETCVDRLKDTGSACGDSSDTLCTNPDTCDAQGSCQPNNQACGFVTDSGLCTFDVGDTCGPDTREFRLIFTPDAQNWIAYKLNGSNPGQYYYNLFVEGTAGSSQTVQVNIPWPFVTHGAMPVHIYDGAEVHVNGCFVPPSDGEALGMQITLGSWLNENAESDGEGVFCPKVAGPGPSGTEADNFCTMEIPVTIPDSGQVYVNIHLDYGLKGTQVDANPFDGLVDRYDKAGNLDALVNTADNTGPVAVPNCRDHRFCHTADPETLDCSSAPPDSSSSVFNADEFKKIAGVFGRLLDGVNGVPNVLVQLTRPSVPGNPIVAFGTSDSDGYYLLAYKHTGKAETYQVVVGGKTFPVTLKANGWSEMNFSWSGTWTLVP
jgi:hypothetical protein